MRGRPIENHSDARVVAAVNKEHEIGGLAEAAGYGVIAERLIYPRSIERMLHQRHELDMRVAHSLDVGNQLGGELAVREPAVSLRGVASPGPCVHFVNGHGR